jgi:hypothetical protein
MITIDEKTKYGTKNVTGTGFRLVHNDTKVVALIEGTEQTITSTNHKAEERSTKQEALTRIDILGLESEPPDIIDSDVKLGEK